MFKQPAGTSRGVYTERKIWYIVVREGAKYGIGECAPLPDLSCERGPFYEDNLERICRETEKTEHIDEDLVRDFPSVRFGLETAFRHLETGSFKLYDSAFSRGEKAITINGLIWMGTFDEMMARIEEKRQKGFRCVKLKIGAIDFEREISLIEHIRKTFTEREIELRVDANGAFSPNDAMSKLERLAKYDIHSIEQPIKAGQWDEMSKLCNATPLPIALDEELIGINESKTKAELLDTIKPQYIILKPTLHGGMAGSDEWIKMAEERQIGWWATSALESNIGLNAIAQWCATKNPEMPQGLGTGQLFTSNFDMPMMLNGDKMTFLNDNIPSTESALRFIGEGK